MPKKTLLCDDNFEFITELIVEICKDLVRNGLNRRIRVNVATLQECFALACESIRFYQLETNNVSFYKEAAHISFWINKMKPIRIVDAEKNGSLLEKTKKKASEIKKEMTGTVAGFHIDMENEREKEKSEFPINEHTALHLALTLIESCQRDYAELQEDARIKSDMLTRISNSAERTQYIEEDLISSLRYHTYSARGLALTLEGLLRVGAF